MTLIPTDLSATRLQDAVRDPNREIAASSRVIDLSVGIVVCIPCFRRPQHLRLTLDSLVNQRTPRSFAVVMVENDAARRESAPVAAEYLADGRLQGICLVEKRQGNCQAINAAFETAQALFPAATRFLMIDDDEIASPDWLELMVRTAEATGADVVGGPVLPVFEDDSRPWLARHPAFCPAYDYTGAVPLIYGCGNCLINYRVQSKAAQKAGARVRVFAQMLARLPLSLLRSARLLATSKAVVAMHPTLVALGSLLAAFGIEPKPYEASKIVS